MDHHKKLPENVINFKAGGGNEAEEIPEAITLEPGEEKLYHAAKDAQKLTVVGVTKRTFDERDYKPVLVAGFDRALEDTKEEEYEHEIPLDEERGVVDNALEKIFSDELGNDHLVHTQLLLRSEKDQTINPEDLSRAASYFSELEYKIGRAKSSIIEKMAANYKKTRVGIRGKGALATEKVNKDMKGIHDQIREIVNFKSDEKIAKLLGLKSIEEYDKVVAIAKSIQAKEAQEAYRSMAQ